MAIFQGNLLSQATQNHYISVESKYFASLGLSTFTVDTSKTRLIENSNSSYDKFISSNVNTISKIYPEFKLITIDQDIYINDINYLLFFNSPYTQNFKYYKATIGAYEEKLLDSNNILQLIIDYEKAILDPNGEIAEEINFINNSATKSIIFEINASAIFGQSGTDTKFWRYPDESPTDDGYKFVKAQIFFQKSGRRNDRVVAQKNTNFVAPPQSSTGLTVSYKDTVDYFKENALSSTEDLLNAVGSVIEAPKDLQNNEIAGPLALHWNKTERKFESGNPNILAKLITRLEIPDIKNVQIPTDELEGNKLNGSDFFSPDSDYYMGGFTVGIAIPLEVQNGNPYAFGPNLKVCNDEKKIEKIRVINRSPRSFEAGTIVMCTKINGEWIVQDFGANLEDTKPAVTQLNDWAFVKLIATSDDYFKDGRFKSAGSPISDIRPDFYERWSRIRFYQNAKPLIVKNESRFGYRSEEVNKLINLNITPDEEKGKFNFELSKRYVICYSQDQDKLFEEAKIKTVDSIGIIDNTITEAVRPGQWGFGETERPGFEIINCEEPSAVEGDIPEQCLCPEGYSPNDAGDKCIKTITEYSRIGTINIEQKLNEDRNTFGVYAWQLKYWWGPVFQEGIIKKDGTVEYNQPAEYFSRLINVEPLYGYNTLGSITSNYLRTRFFDRKLSIEDYPKIPSVHKMQFSPLQDAVVGGMDPYSPFYRDWDRRFAVRTPRLLQDALDRTSALAGGTEFTEKVPILAAVSCDFSVTDKDLLAANTPNVGMIKYDCFIRQSPLSVPLGAPDYFRDTGNFIGANCFGVTCATAVASKKSGGSIRFSVNQDIGLNQKRTVTSANTTMSIILGAFIGGDPGFVKQNGFSQWGSSTDSYFSAGTTALHVRVFDYVEDGDFLYDPRYFAVLNFNPSLSGDREEALCKETNPDDDEICIECEPPTDEEAAKLITVKLEDGKCFKKKKDPNGIDQYILAYEDFPGTTESITPVDLKIPTNKNGGIIFSETTFTGKDEWKLQSEWTINPIRRGMLLTNGGFNYLYHVAGLTKENSKITSAGSGYAADSVITLTRGIKIKILAVDNDGGITDFAFENNDLEEPLRGTDFTPNDFSGPELEFNEEKYKTYTLNIPKPNPGNSAQIKFTKGVVYLKRGRDEEPKEYGSTVGSGNKVRLSASSNAGEGFVRGTTETAIDVEKNSSGKYRLFFHFHNDITHTPTFESSYIAAFAQYMLLSIT